MAPKPIIERNWQITFNKSNCSGWVDQLKGVHSYSFIWYSNGVLAWDFPERVPEYVKNRIYKELMKLKKQAKTKKSRTQAKADYRDKKGRVLNIPQNKKSRFVVVGPWHGESATLYYVYDNKLEEWVESVYTREAAKKRCEVLNGLYGKKGGRA